MKQKTLLNKAKEMQQAWLRRAMHVKGHIYRALVLDTYCDPTINVRH